MYSELTAEIVYLIWPVNASTSLRGSWKVLLGRTAAQGAIYFVDNNFILKIASMYGSLNEPQLVPLHLISCLKTNHRDTK